MTRSIRTLIVDDEPVARSLLLDLLSAHSVIEVVGEAVNGSEAIALIEQRDPDLVFLDVQMPELDGFDVIARIRSDRMPAVVFVTAYDAHALRAFRVNAVDYLLKPLDPTMVAEAVGRVVARGPMRADRAQAGLLTSLLESMRPATSYLRRFAVRDDGRVRFVDVDDVDWIEAADKRLVLHAGRQRHEIRGAISTIESELDPAMFRRVHRSAIVNVRSIVELQPWFQQGYVLVLRDNSRVTTSASYRHVIDELLAGH